jgi:hypothetical protein
MRQQKHLIAAVILLSSQMVSLAGPAPASGARTSSADAPIMAAPGNLSEIRAGGVSLTAPSLSVPAGSDSSLQLLTIPGGITPKGAAIPAINPLSISPRAATATSTVKPSAAFLSPESETELSIKFGTLHLMPGCLVLLVSAEDTVSIYDLHDGKDRDVFVEAEGHKLALTPGKQVTLARSQYPDLAAANKLPYVAYSSTEKQQINEDVVCFKGNYDVYSLIFRYPPFKELLASKDPKMRKTAEKVLKTAVIMNQMVANARYYSGSAAPSQAKSVK